MREGKEGRRKEILRILEDDGRGESWIKRLRDRRKKRKREGTGTDEDGRTVDGHE